MKNYDEIAENLFERRDEYFKEKKKRNEKIIKAAAGTVGVLVVAFAAVGIFKSGVLNSNKPQSKAPETTQSAPNTTKADDESYKAYDSAQDAAESNKATPYNDSCDTASKGGNTETADTASEGNIEKTTTAVEATTKKYKKSEIVSSLDGAASYGMPCYVLPQNGECTMSYPVRTMVDKYGNRKKYLVYIDICKNNIPVTDNEVKNAEYSRLKKAGVDIKKYKLWSYSGANADKIYYTHVGGVFTYEQLTTLFTGREYGYFIEFMTNGDSSPVDESAAVGAEDFFEKTTVREYN